MTSAAPGSDIPSRTRLFVGNIGTAITESALIRLFQRYGSVLHEEYMWHRAGPSRGAPKGFAFVVMATPEEAERAKRALDCKTVNGRRLTVRYASHKVGVVRHAQLATGAAAAAQAAKESRSLESSDDIASRIAAIKAQLQRMREEQQAPERGTGAQPVKRREPGAAAGETEAVAASAGGAQKAQQGRVVEERTGEARGSTPPPSKRRRGDHEEDEAAR